MLKVHQTEDTVQLYDNLTQLFLRKKNFVSAGKINQEMIPADFKHSYTPFEKSSAEARRKHSDKAFLIDHLTENFCECW